MHIRWIVRRDMAEVLEIENKSFEYLWTEEDLIQCLRCRRNIGMVIETKEKVAGFMIYELHKNRLELLNFAVHPDFRNQGAGSEMINKLKDKLSDQRRKSITLNIRESNLTGLLFFKKHGFQAISIFRNFYDDCNEDAFLMRYHISPVLQTRFGCFSQEKIYG